MFEVIRALRAIIPLDRRACLAWKLPNNLLVERAYDRLQRGLLVQTPNKHSDALRRRFAAEGALGEGDELDGQVVVGEGDSRSPRTLYICDQGRANSVKDFGRRAKAHVVVHLFDRGLWRRQFSIQSTWPNNLVVQIAAVLR
ncbi:MAG: hypothetical protein Q7O66_05870 [Dehalococcoidia bacterium]|nr:hypothetical protein [Dehalococcoidia bacterium]